MNLSLSTLSPPELAEQIEAWRTGPAALRPPLYAAARALRDRHYGPRVLLRGLVECSSVCVRDCLYCGLRRSNRRAGRFRLSPDDIFACCRDGYALGFRSFVLQGGEDPALDDGVLLPLIHRIKSAFPDCALTLSLGEKPRESFQAYFGAGANRYLLRHETATPAHFASLHPGSQSWQTRRRCLYDLRDIGFQVGAGFMVGTPGQTAAHLAADLVFLRELRPHMVGIAPFLPHHDTPLAGHPAGSLSDTLLMLALTRLLLPDVLLPATTALASLQPDGRELGLLAGANVVMPALAPPSMRDAYHLYDGKLHTGAEAAEGLAELSARLAAIGLSPDFSRGDHPSFPTV